MYGELPFQLLEGEQIVEDIKPLPSLRLYYILGGFSLYNHGRTISPFFTLIFFLTFIIGFGRRNLMFFLGNPILLIFFLIPIFFLIFSVIVGFLKYKNRHYWITNKRIIFKRGIFGYKVSSIPLERISDVVISRTFWENLFGFGSVRVQSLAGQVSPYRGGSEGDLAAVPDPEKTQQNIFKLISYKRKQEGLTI